MIDENTRIYKNFGNKVDIENIPKSLKYGNKWVLWTYIKEKKVPITFDEKNRIKAIDALLPQHWSSIEDLKKYVEEGYGLMYVLVGSGYWVIDFDEFDEIEEVKEIVAKANSYAEITPSGRGFRLWFFGPQLFKSDAENIKVVINSETGKQIEVFFKRQVVVTGWKLSEASEIKGCTQEFAEFLISKYPELKKYYVLEEVEIEDEDDEEITSCDKIKINKTNKIFVSDELLITSNDYFYVAKFNSASPCVILHSNKKLNLGLNKLFLKKMKLSTFLNLQDHLLYHLLLKVDYYLAKSEKSNRLPIHLTFNNFWKSQTTKTFREFAIDKLEEYERIQNMMKTIYFYEVVNSVDLSVYKPKDIEDVKEFLSKYVFCDAVYDESIKKLFSAYNYDIDQEFNRFSAYNPHSIIITKTKAGKSFLAKHMGVLYDIRNVTSAALTGYSTSDTQRESVLNNIRSCLFFDELSSIQDLQKNLSSGLLDLMESGIINVSKGMATLEAIYSNSFVFMSNKDLVEKYSEEKAFLKILLTISNNIEAIASRLGVVFIKNNTETAKTLDKKNKKYYDLYFEVNRSLKELMGKFYVKLLDNDMVLEFLEEEYDDEYKKQIKELAKQFTIPELNTFVLSHLESYRHARGAALRIALYDADILYNILHQVELTEEFIDTILTRAKDYFKYIKSINYNSLKSLVNISFQEFERIKIEYWNSVNSFSDALKILILTIRLFNKENPDITEINTINKECSFVNFYNQKVRQIFGDLYYAEKYSRVEPKISNINNEVLETIGLSIEKSRDNEYLIIKIKNTEKLHSEYLDKMTLRTTGKTLKYYFDLYCGLYNQNNQADANEEREIDKKLSEVAKKVYEDNRIGREWMVCDLISCFSTDEDIDFELIKKYYSKKFPDVEYVDYLIRKLSEEGLIYEYKPRTYRKTFDFEVREFDDE